MQSSDLDTVAREGIGGNKLARSGELGRLGLFVRASPKQPRAGLHARRFHLGSLIARVRRAHRFDAPRPRMRTPKRRHPPTIFSDVVYSTPPKYLATKL